MNRSRHSRTKLPAKIISALLLAVFPAVAQQQQQPCAAPASQDQSKPDQSKPDQSKPDQPKPDQPKSEDQKTVDPKDVVNPQSGTSNDRLFYTLPNFLTVQNSALPPLTVGQKFKVVARGSFDYIEFPWYAALAGVSQAENSEPGYGQGAEGYGKRYGAAFADGTIENFMTGAVFPSVLKQDPRFYQSGRGSFFRRTGYAISRIFVTRTDAGGQQFNFSEIFGSALSAGISTYSYHPHADKTLSNTASVWGTQVGLDTVTIVIKEFWPDIRKKISRMRQGETVRTN